MLENVGNKNEKDGKSMSICTNKNHRSARRLFRSPPALQPCRTCVWRAPGSTRVWMAAVPSQQLEPQTCSVSLPSNSALCLSTKSTRFGANKIMLLVKTNQMFVATKFFPLIFQSNTHPNRGQKNRPRTKQLVHRRKIGWKSWRAPPGSIAGLEPLQKAGSGVPKQKAQPWVWSGRGRNAPKKNTGKP